MPKFTVTTAIDLPDDELDSAELLTKSRPVIAHVEAWLKDQTISGVVSWSLDGRKAPRAKTTASVEPLSPIVAAVPMEAAPEYVTEVAMAHGSRHARAGTGD